jgi:DNA-binding transcriptional LysR family regulator
VLWSSARSSRLRRFTLKTGTTWELVEQVLNRQIDGAFVCGPVTHPHLVVEPFVQEELVILTGPSISRFDDLLAKPDFPFIVLRLDVRIGFGWRRCWRGIVGIRICEQGTLETIFACVSAGLGVTLLPKAAAMAVPSGLAAFVLLPIHWARHSSPNEASSETNAADNDMPKPTPAN